MRQTAYALTTHVLFFIKIRWRVYYLGEDKQSEILAYNKTNLSVNSNFQNSTI